MSNSREQELRKELLRRELASRQNENNQQIQPESFLQKAGEFAEQKFNKPFKENIVDPALGFSQGIANIPSGIANLGISGINALAGKNISHVPYFDIAPHTPQAKLGELASFFAGPGAISKTAKGISEISNIDKFVESMPRVAEAMNKVRDIVKNNPLKSNVVGNSLLGGVYSPDNPLLGLGIGAAVPIVGKTFNSVAGSLEQATNKIKPRDIAKSIQKEHDAAEKYSSDLFKKVGKEAKSRGVDKIPVENHLFYKVEKYLPDTDAAKKLLNNAKRGDYKSIQKLQSELWQRGTNHLRSELPSESAKGEEILDLRNKINKNVSKHFRNTGHHDLDKSLNEARFLHHKLKKDYYSHPTIAKLVHPESRKIPKNFSNVLSEESKQMERVKKVSPNVMRQIEDLTNKENSLKKLKYLGGSVAGAGLLGSLLSAPEGYHKLINALEK